MESVEAKLRALMIEAQRGDAAAYETLLRLLISHLRAYFRRRLGGAPDIAEDLVQETLIAVHNQRHTYLPTEPFTPWLHAIGKYKLIDHLRRAGRRSDLPLPDDDSYAMIEDTAADAANARRDIGKLLADLPARFRLPLQHVKLEGLSVEEAAAHTGMSVSAVKVGIHRGMKALARGLSGGGNADR